MMRASDVLSSIDKSLWNARNEENDLRERVQSQNESLMSLRTKIAELYRKLAIIRLDQTSETILSQPLMIAEQKAREKLKSFKQRQIEFENIRLPLNQTLAQKEQEQHDLLHQLEEIQEKIQQQENLTKASLKTNEEWKLLLKKAETIVEQIDAAEKKVKLSEADRNKKCQPYQNDKLFMYLNRRYYGTPQYSGSFFTRWGDAFVARTIGYEEMRQNYFLLNEIPKRLEDHVQGLQKKLTESADEQKAFYRKKLEEEGILPLEKALANIMAKQRTAKQEFADIQGKIAEIDKKIQSLLQGDHPEGLIAVTRELVAALQAESISNLMQISLQTPTPQDEQIVHSISSLSDEMKKGEAQLSLLRERANQLKRNRSMLERSREDFQNAGYDQLGGSFSNGQAIQNILSQILIGALTHRELREILRQNYQRPYNPPRDPFRRGSRWGDDDPFGGWGGGNGGGPFGGGSWGGSGRRGSSSGGGGGGFRTGGGF